MGGGCGKGRREYAFLVTFPISFPAPFHPHPTHNWPISLNFHHYLLKPVSPSLIDRSPVKLQENLSVSAYSEQHLIIQVELIMRIGMEQGFFHEIIAPAITYMEKINLLWLQRTDSHTN